MTSQDNAPATAKNGWGARLFALANSNLGLLVFGALLITPLSHAYADYQAQLKAKAETREALSRLIVELELRSQELRQDALTLKQLLTQKEQMGNAFAASWDGYVRDLDAVVAGAMPYGPSAPVYKNVNLMSLLNQVDLLERDELSRAPITETQDKTARVAAGPTQPQGAEPAVLEMMRSGQIGRPFDAPVIGPRLVSDVQDILMYEAKRRLDFECSDSATGRSALPECQRSK